VSITERVQIPSYTDSWMRGDRYGEVVNVTKAGPSARDPVPANARLSVPVAQPAANRRAASAKRQPLCRRLGRPDQRRGHAGSGRGLRARNRGGFGSSIRPPTSRAFREAMMD
jgi:hypothetical protein